jgi:hypothetical protein
MSVCGEVFMIVFVPAGECGTCGLAGQEEQLVCCACGARCCGACVELHGKPVVAGS